MKAIVKSSLHHDGKAHAIGSEIELTDELANSLAKIGVVEIVSTIVNKDAEQVPSAAPQEVEAEAQEEAPKALKKTSKRRIDSDDE